MSDLDQLFPKKPADFGTAGSIWQSRSMEPSTGRRRRMCRCGCRKRQTHTGYANGVGLYNGCEDAVQLWVVDPAQAFHATAERSRQADESLIPWAVLLSSKAYWRYRGVPRLFRTSAAARSAIRRGNLNGAQPIRVTLHEIKTTDALTKADPRLVALATAQVGE